MLYMGLGIMIAAALRPDMTIGALVVVIAISTIIRLLLNLKTDKDIGKDKNDEGGMASKMKQIAGSSLLTLVGGLTLIFRLVLPQFSILPTSVNCK